MLRDWRAIARRCSIASPGSRLTSSAVSPAGDTRPHSSSISGAHPTSNKLRPSAKRVYLDLYNIESAWHRSMADSEQRIAGLGPPSIRRKRRWNWSATGCRGSIAFWPLPCSDAKLVQAIVPDAQVTVYPNALPLIVPPPRSDRLEIIFSGNLEYAPNIAAVRFFHRDVWPALQSRWPELKWKILGKNPGPFRDLARARSEHRDHRLRGRRCCRHRAIASGHRSAAGWKRNANQDSGGVGRANARGFHHARRRGTGMPRSRAPGAGRRSRKLHGRGIRTSRPARTIAIASEPPDAASMKSNILGKLLGKRWIPFLPVTGDGRGDRLIRRGTRAVYSGIRANEWTAGIAKCVTNPCAT